MAHMTHLDHAQSPRKFAAIVSKSARPKDAPTPKQSPTPVVRERQDAEGYDQVDRRLMDTFPASDAVGRY